MTVINLKWTWCEHKSLEIKGAGCDSLRHQLYSCTINTPLLLTMQPDTMFPFIHSILKNLFLKFYFSLVSTPIFQHPWKSDTAILQGRGSIVVIMQWCRRVSGTRRSWRWWCCLSHPKHRCANLSPRLQRSAAFQDTGCTRASGIMFSLQCVSFGSHFWGKTFLCCVSITYFSAKQKPDFFATVICRCFRWTAQSASATVLLFDYLLFDYVNIFCFSLQLNMLHFHWSVNWSLHVRRTKKKRFWWQFSNIPHI